MIDDKRHRRIFEKIRGDPFAHSMGIELLELSDGYSKVAMTVKESMVNFLGMPHGAAIYALGDAAFAAAGNSRGEVEVALNVNIHYRSSPKVGSKLIAEGRREHSGGRTALYRMTVTTEQGEIIAQAEGLAYRKRESFIEPNE